MRLCIHLPLSFPPSYLRYVGESYPGDLSLGKSEKDALRRGGLFSHPSNHSFSFFPRSSPLLLVRRMTRRIFAFHGHVFFPLSSFSRSVQNRSVVNGDKGKKRKPGDSGGEEALAGNCIVFCRESVRRRRNAACRLFENKMIGRLLVTLLLYQPMNAKVISTCRRDGEIKFRITVSLK